MENGGQREFSNHFRRQSTGFHVNFSQEEVLDNGTTAADRRQKFHRRTQNISDSVSTKLVAAFEH